MIFRFTVTDHVPPSAPFSLKESATDTITITIKNTSVAVNREPTANAGGDVSFVEHQLVTLDGSKSSDPDGDTLTYAWTQTSGIDITSDPLFDPKAKKLQFTAPEVPADRTLQFKLIVNDGKLNSSPDRATVTITAIPEPKFNNPPVASGDSIKHLGSDSVTIDVLFNDSDKDGDTITIQSVDTTGTAGTVKFTDTDLTFDPTDDVFGRTTFTYTISDGAKTDSATVEVTVIYNSGGGDALLYIPNPDLTHDGHMGKRVTQIDDVNGDGFNDIVASEKATVYLFDGNTENTNGGNVIARLSNPSTATNDNYGYGLATLGSDKIYVGAPTHDGGGIRDTGVVYVFNSAGALQTTLAPAELISRDTFGAAITAYSNKVAVGVPGYDVTVSASSTMPNIIITIDESTQSATTQD